MKNRGLTLLEVIFASAVLIIIMAAAYLMVDSSTKMTEMEMTLRDAQFQLQLRTDQISQELRESSQGLIRAESFTDVALPVPAQTLLVIPSARDDSNQFQVSKAKALWQKLVIYAPYFDPVLNESQLRRYEITPVPDVFAEIMDPPPTITVTDAEIDLGGTLVPRNGGERIMSRFDFLSAALNGSSLSLSMSLQGSTVTGTKEVNLQSGVRGRNNN